ncbi:serine/threonine-protein phosphatase 2A regulatory subunit A [Nematocida sp. LUAm3]|nr:serine/threonine-protein phosphatase 2A regulatory subunit A [Nematocida sp. LUAm3]KAI5173970.1 serine/threonine-protein phosphatase 2A regulatory subunit A [Nematocida sp. LUAm2]KAI5177285.1 serine/threonine-protein phosphatase 2A regulatory subunit A [Nematocida sp. LUAm1]
MQESPTISYEDIEQEVERMQSSNTKIRDSSLENLYRISQKIGSIYTVQYMMPFIKSILDTNEEAKRPLILPMQKIVEELLEDIAPVLPIYKEIFLTRDNKIREEAADSLFSSIKEMAKKTTKKNPLLQIEEFIIELGKSHFSMHRLSSISLIRRLCEKNRAHDSTRTKELFSSLLGDAYAIVRKRAFSSTHVLSSIYSEEEVKKLTEKSIEDEEDTVREQFIHPLSLLQKSEETASFYMKIFYMASKDLSWKVRSASAMILTKVLENVFSTNADGKEVLQCIDILCMDKEVSVRKKIIEVLPKLFNEIPQMKNNILEIIEKAVADPSATIRKQLPSCLGQISEDLSPEEVEKTILPLIRKLLLDVKYEVKMETITNLQMFYSKLGSASVAATLNPIISDLESPNWRTRSAVIRSISSFATQMGEEYFNEYLNSSFFQLFIDQVWIIRKEAATVLADISVGFKEPWVEEKAIPSLKYLKESSSYAHRISYVTAINSLAQKEFSSGMQDLLMQELQELSKDPVDQVRYVVAKGISTSSLKSHPIAKSILKEDSFKEVQRFINS